MDYWKCWIIAEVSTASNCIRILLIKVVQMSLIFAYSDEASPLESSTHMRTLWLVFWVKTFVDPLDFKLKLLFVFVFSTIDRLFIWYSCHAMSIGRCEKYNTRICAHWAFYLLTVNSRTSGLISTEKLKLLCWKLDKLQHCLLVNTTKLNFLIN